MLTSIRDCPVCSTPSSNASIFLKQNIDSSKMSEFSFASRKMPEFMCHQLVHCPVCDLVYANEPPDQSVLAHAYHIADFDSSQEADDAANAYEKAVLPILEKINNKEAALEIGTGTGVFLEILKNNNFKILVGVEPSSAAIAAAPRHRQKWIKEAIFKESDFEKESFDFICCFMTLEHVRDPNELVLSVFNLLKPGGAIALVTHDYRSLINRILGKKSPIIDIEHMQLFSNKSITNLLKNNNYENIKVNSFKNKYSVNYWIRLLPLNLSIKKYLIKFICRVGLSNTKISLNVGNIISCGFKPKKCS